MRVSTRFPLACWIIIVSLIITVAILDENQSEALRRRGNSRVIRIREHGGIILITKTGVVSVAIRVNGMLR